MVIHIDDAFNDTITNDEELRIDDICGTFRGDGQDSTSRSCKRKERRLTTAAKVCFINYVDLYKKKYFSVVIHF
jgi:hypothetical protein